VTSLVPGSDKFSSRCLRGVTAPPADAAGGAQGESLEPLWRLLRVIKHPGGRARRLLVASRAQRPTASESHVVDAASVSMPRRKAAGEERTIDDGDDGCWRPLLAWRRRARGCARCQAAERGGGDRARRLTRRARLRWGERTRLTNPSGGLRRARARRLLRAAAAAPAPAALAGSSPRLAGARPPGSPAEHLPEALERLEGLLAQIGEVEAARDQEIASAAAAIRRRVAAPLRQPSAMETVRGAGLRRASTLVRQPPADPALCRACPPTALGRAPMMREQGVRKAAIPPAQAVLAARLAVAAPPSRTRALSRCHTLRPGEGRVRRTPSFAMARSC